jgi:hypothetical protein
VIHQADEVEAIATPFKENPTPSTKLAMLPELTFARI